MKLRTPVATAALAIGLLVTPAASVAAQTELELATPVEVTGTFTIRMGTCSGVDAAVGDVKRDIDTCHPAWKMSDERLNGELTWVIAGQTARLGDGELVVDAGALTVDNDDGTWQERPLVYAFDYPGRIDAGTSSINDVDTRVFDGRGGYEGLVAVIDFVGSEDGVRNSPVRLQGFILDGALPPSPGAATSR